MSLKQQKYFCTICCIQFQSLEDRNVHLKSDYHVFNAKRQAVGMPPIPLEKYKDIAHAEKVSSTPIEIKIYYCSLCKKRYNSEQKMNEHENSKKHKANMRRFPERAENCISEEIIDDNERDSDSDEFVDVEKIVRIAEMKRLKETQNETMIKSSEEKKSTQEQVEDKENDEIEIIDDEKIDEIIKERQQNAPQYSSKHCLFCPTESESIEDNLEHMEKDHAFFIPNVECCCDIEGLLLYLHDKICIGYMCIWCDHSKASFKHYKDVRQHMIDSCHCKMLYENENLDEYDCYYDYSSVVHAVEIVSMDDVSMTLSNGKVIGHRSMANYYKQHIKPVEQRQLTVVNNKERMPIPEQNINRCVGSKALVTSNDQEYIQSVKDALRRQITNSSRGRDNQSTYRKWTREGVKYNKMFVPRTWLHITAPNQL